MSSPTDDGWVITTTPADQQKTAHPYHPFLVSHQDTSAHFTRTSLQPSFFQSSNSTRHGQLNAGRHNIRESRVDQQREYRLRRKQQQKEFWTSTHTSPLPEMQSLSTKSGNMDPSEYVSLLILTYGSAENVTNLKAKIKMSSLGHSIAELLKECSDPYAWTQSVLKELYQSESYNNILWSIPTLEFQRLMAITTCTGLQLVFNSQMKPSDGILDQQLQQQQQRHDNEELDLIIFSDDDDDDDDDDGNDISISTFDQTTSSQYYHQKHPLIIFSDDDDDDDGNDISISTVDQTTSSQYYHQKHPLTKQHQIAFINMIYDIQNTAILYYAIDVFCMGPLLAADGEYQEGGSTLCRNLLLEGWYIEALICIRKLNHEASFPLYDLARLLFDQHLCDWIQYYVKGRPSLQHSLLLFINIQLGYNFAGRLGIVDDDRLSDAKVNKTKVPPIQGLSKKTFQKRLKKIAERVAIVLGVSLNEYYFIWLSKQYDVLRYIASNRSTQQLVERDYSLKASSNYNGLLEHLAIQDTALAKLTIKLLWDFKDINGARYFARHFHQESFLDRYKRLRIGERMVGGLVGEKISRRPIPTKKQINSMNSKFYSLPQNVNLVMVNDMNGLIAMNHKLCGCKMCALNWESLPEMVTDGYSQVTLLQIAIFDGVVYLLDMKALLRPEDLQLRDETEHVLRKLFESKSCMKLGYGFANSIKKLGLCLPSNNDWTLENFKDMKNAYPRQRSGYHGQVVNSCPHISDILIAYLGVSLYTKQRLSNWETRPLTNEQVAYAASHAYCLLDIYAVLAQSSHPFATSKPVHPIQVSGNHLSYLPIH